MLKYYPIVATSGQISPATESLSRPSRVAFYARVSTTNGQQDPEMQLRELREYAQRRGFTVFGEYVDRISGDKERRPALDRLLGDCHKRKVDAVLVYRYDRSPARCGSW